MRTPFSTTPNDVNLIDNQYENAIKSGDVDHALQLAMEQAQSRGYDTFAWHGTYAKFDEFKDGDIGFHFAKDKKLALNRISDTYCEAKRHDYPTGKVLHVAISLHNPIVLSQDLDDWGVRSIVDKAAYKLLGTPYESQQSIYLCEQRGVAQDAWRLLKSIGIDKETAKDWQHGLHSRQQSQLELLYGKILHKRCIQSCYDGIVYQNEYEDDGNCDPTCYIVFTPSQIKSIEPVYDNGHLVPLSSRFDRESPKFTR